jgi:heptosyltransferase II
MVMAVPFLKSLRATLDGELWGIGKNSTMQVYNGLDLFDRFIPYNNRGLVPFLDTVSLLKNTPFDRAIMLPHSFRAALLFYTAGVKERIGYARNGRGFMLTGPVPEGRDLEPTLEHYLGIADFMGANRVIDRPVLTATPEEEQRFDEKFMDINRPYAVFIAGAQYGPSKRWPEAHFSALADMIADRLGMNVYVLPGKGEEKLAGTISDNACNKEKIHVKSLDIRELKVCLSRASVVISNDTGPRHIAVALSVPTVVLLGPMDEKYTRYPSLFTHVMYKDLPCRPCNKKSCDLDHACLKGVRPEDVYTKVEEILNGQIEKS